jgi:hypothetical protein
MRATFQQLIGSSASTLGAADAGMSRGCWVPPRAVPLLFYAESKVIGPRAQGCTRTTKCHAHETGAVATTKASFKELDQSTQVSNTLCMIY